MPESRGLPRRLFALPARSLACPRSRPYRVVCVGAHPEDAETGCGGIRGGEPVSSGRIRTAESLAACDQLDAVAVFGNQIDGKTTVDAESSRAFSDLLLGLEPDLMSTHWPIDTHADHRTAASLTYQARQWAAESFTSPTTR